jgi:hypothetical protein
VYKLSEATTKKQNFFRRFFLDPYLALRSKVWCAKKYVLMLINFKLVRSRVLSDYLSKLSSETFDNSIFYYVNELRRKYTNYYLKFFMRVKSSWMILLGICGVATFSLSIAFLFCKQLCFTHELFSFVKLIFAHNTIAITKLVLVMFFSFWVGLHCLVKGSILSNQVTKTLRSIQYGALMQQNKFTDYFLEKKFAALQDIYYDINSPLPFRRWATECCFRESIELETENCLEQRIENFCEELKECYTTELRLRRAEEALRDRERDANANALRVDYDYDYD